MISFQWQGLTIAVGDDGKLALNGSVQASPEALEALGEVLFNIGRLIAVESETGDAQRRVTATAPAADVRLAAAASPATAATPVIQAPRAATPVTAPTATAPTATAPPRATPAFIPAVAAADSASTKPGPRQTAAWLSGAPIGLVVPQGTAAVAAAAAPEAAVLAPDTAVPLAAAPPAAPALARSASTTATVAPVAVRGLVKPGPKRTAAYLAGDEAAFNAPDLNAGLMTPIVTVVSKPGPVQTQQFLRDADDRAVTATAPESESDVANEAVAAAKARPDSAPAGVPAASTTVEFADASVSADAEPVRRTPKGQLRREMQRWLEERGGPAQLQEFVAAAEAEGWSLAANVEPSIVSALRKHADVFLRNPDGSFALRAGRAPAKIVRRRAVRHHEDT